MTDNARPASSPTQSALDVVFAIAEAIRTITLDNSNRLGGVPNGHLWAQMDGKISFANYNATIALLKRAKLVEERSHLLVWVGPRVTS